jgi:hypothetical protein
MIPADYFSRPDAPSKNSPIGNIMKTLSLIYPTLDCEYLREIARQRYIGGQFNYTPEERSRMPKARNSSRLEQRKLDL